MTARWTLKARQRLQQLYDHIAEDKPENAQRFVDRVDASCLITSIS